MTSFDIETVRVLKTIFKGELDTNSYTLNSYSTSVSNVSHEIFYFQKKKFLINHKIVKHFVQLCSIYIQKHL